MYYKVTKQKQPRRTRSSAKKAAEEVHDVDEEEVLKDEDAGDDKAEDDEPHRAPLSAKRRK